MDILKTIGAVLLGLIVGSILNMLVLQVNSWFFPMPEGLSYEDTEAFVAWTKSLPATAYIGILAAHMAQAFGGGWLAARLSPHPLVAAMVVGVLSLAGGVANGLMLQQPWWMWGELPLYLVVAWAAARLELGRRAG